MSYLTKAVSSLRNLNIAVSTTNAPVIALLEHITKYDNTKVTSIAATLQQSSAFNAAIRDQIKGMDISTRYADITTGFNTIRDDAAQMASWMEDGRLDLKEKLKLTWMKARRGSIPDRFEKIRETYLQVSSSANDQISRESAILDAYMDFRMALKESEIDAQSVLTIATEALTTKKQELDQASKNLESHTGDLVVKTKLELARDEALRALQAEDKSFQIVKDIADDLKVAYSTAQLVFARLMQTHAVKERLYQRGVTFFATHEVVFSGLAASFTSMAGLGEATNTMDAMADGMSKGLESLASTGSKQLEAGLRAGYGTTLKVESVKALANAVVDFQESSLALIKELRNEATQASREIEAATEDGQRRFAALVSKGV